MSHTMFQGVRIDHYKRQFAVYSGVYADKPQIDEGGKIILPSRALEELANMNIVWPIMLKVTNPAKKISTHCGVLEFSAEPGRAYIPYWMQQHLRLDSGDRVVIENASLPKGSYVKIRPQEKAFIENISDPKAVLEQKLRNFSCLTVGDTIMIRHLDRDYAIDILEVKAGSHPNINAISIVETDVEVDFERPLDMPPTPEPVSRDQIEQQFGQVGAAPSDGGTAVIGGSRKTQKRRYRSKKEKEEERALKEKEEAEARNRFLAFQGSGRRLDGKPVRTLGASPPTTSFVDRAAPQPSTQPKEQTTSSSSTDNGKDNTDDKKAVESKFVPFGGRGRTLK